MQQIFTALGNFKSEYLTWLNLPIIYPTDIIEIILISVLFYYVMTWIQDTRAWMLFKGLLVILLFVLMAAVFQMNTILWIAEKAINVGMIALVILFQPELRKALEQLGRRNFLNQFLTIDYGRQNIHKFSERTVNEITKACFEMSKVKTGALIVVEDSILLSEFERTGIGVDAILTSQLLINIFEKNTPLHDGAIIVRGNRVASATCYLPLSDNIMLSKELGTRHRAAIGVSEVSDALTIVVSEETGKVSVAKGGKLFTNLNQEELKSQLKAMQSDDIAETRFSHLKRRIKNAK
ncbi:MAG: diadenylate cyclase CdaA [Lachnospiraceae bacterium]